MQEFKEDLLYIKVMEVAEILTYRYLNSAHSGGFYNLKPNYSSIYYFNNNLRKYKDFPIKNKRKLFNRSKI